MYRAGLIEALALGYVIDVDGRLSITGAGDDARHSEMRRIVDGGAT
ncbi:hypothetical protein BH09MYX1_BH09MYX1_00880 [soil metagenome]